MSQTIPAEYALEVYQVCHRLNICRDTLYRWLRKPDCTIVWGKRGGRVFIDSRTLPEIEIRAAQK